ncbi:MAG: hypothetical protein NZ750_13885, partial [Anaerolineae bacterium]|nr:hypothetical protein [Anaerolineae bacterium]MDW8172890.1 hypothetical protein [Anaerolineae bacterium]
VHYTGAFMRDIAQEIAVKIVQMMDEPTRRMLGLPRADEPVFRFGASWELLDWHISDEDLRPCQSISLTMWWQPVEKPEYDRTPVLVVPAIVVQNASADVLLKEEMLLTVFKGAPGDWRIYPVEVRLNIPCDAEPGKYDVALAMSLCEEDDSTVCKQQEASTAAGGLGAYPYLKTIQIVGG